MLTKEEILKKIKEWAKENDGRTPSEKIIKEELGIPKWEWINYWTKTTDIQREAGLIPQIFDRTKYTKKDLCEEFIKLIRKKGKWPSRDELDFERRQNPKLPASATFYAKLGLTKNLAKTIVEFVKDKQGYDDVIEICRPVEKLGDQEGFEEDNEQIAGEVYMIKRYKIKGYKIGFSKDTVRRMKEHGTQSPEPLELIWKIYTDDPGGIEAYWHDRFKTKRMNESEWFNLSSSDVRAFKRWKKIY